MRTNRVNYVRQVTEIERIQPNLAFLTKKRGETGHKVELHSIDDDDDLENARQHYHFEKKGTIVNIKDVVRYERHGSCYTGETRAMQ